MVYLKHVEQSLDIIDTMQMVTVVVLEKDLVTTRNQWKGDKKWAGNLGDIKKITLSKGK